jgi:dTDP-4-dehydrorhamnose 3,5-epimerase
MNIFDTGFEGLKIVEYFRAPDDRGIFVKPWLQEELKDIFGEVSEAYFSFSNQGVFRGLHFQDGLKAQKKYIVCLSGSIEDIAVDLRKDSKTYKKVFRMKLDSMNGKGIIVPEGFAHGIFAHEDSTIVNFCDKPYSPGDEGGIFWNSMPELRDLNVTTVSKNDAHLKSLGDY